MKYILYAVLPIIMFGCASPSLVRQMKAHGVTDNNTGKIVLTGSEADVGPGITVTIEEQYLIQEIWDSIYESRPHGLWYASGYRRADFYTDRDPKPAATLWINESDAAHLDGTSTRFRCPHLHCLVMKLLEDQAGKGKAE